MINAKLDTLDLKWRKRNADTKCDMCDLAVEDFKHFLLHCKQYSELRKEHKFMQQPYKQD